MKTKTEYLKTFCLMFFCLAIGIALVVPISSAAWGLIRTQQDFPGAEVPDALNSAGIPPMQEVRPDWRPSFAPPPAAPTNLSPNPFAPTAVFPQPGPLAFAGAHPMNSFVKKIQDAKDEDEKQKAIDEARASLEKQYDRYIEGYQKQVDEMEERMQNLRDQLDKRKDAKRRLVDLKLELLINEADGLGWPEAKNRFVSPPAIPRVATNFGNPLLTNSVGPFTPSMKSTNKRVEMMNNKVSSLNELSKCLQDGISLLERGEYGEFLDQFLEPAVFRNELKSKTLDQLCSEFKKERAQQILALFKAAPNNKLVFGPSNNDVSWESEDGQNLRLRRGESGWYLNVEFLNELKN